MVLNPHATFAHALWAWSEHFGDLAQGLTIEIDGDVHYVYFRHPTFSGVGTTFDTLKGFLISERSPFQGFPQDIAVGFQERLLAYHASIPRHLMQLTAQTYEVWHTDPALKYTTITDVGQKNDDLHPLGVEIQQLSTTELLGKNLLALSHHETLELAQSPLVFSLQQQCSTPRFSYLKLKNFGHGVGLVVLDLDDCATEQCLGYARIKAD